MSFERTLKTKDSNHKTYYFSEGYSDSLTHRTETSTINLSLLVGNYKALSKRLATGSNPNEYDENGATALYYAILLGKLEVVNLLLEHGANIHQTNRYDLSPFKAAIYKNNPKLLHDLAQAPISQYDYLEPVLNFLISRVDTPESIRLTQLQLLLHYPTIKHSINFQDNKGNSPLHRAIECQDITFIECLLAAGANPYLHNDSGQTPIDIAIASNNLAAVSKLYLAMKNASQTDFKKFYPLNEAFSMRSIELMSLFLEYGANINEVNADGDCVLHRAIRCKEENIIKFLLEHGCQVNQLDNYGCTALDIAARIDYVDCLKLLLNSQDYTLLHAE